MAAKKTESNFLSDSIVIEAAPEKQKYTGPTVRVFLPKLEDPGDAGIKVDQYEHVTIANEEGEYTWNILRGVWQDIPVPAFIALKEKYPDL